MTIKLQRFIDRNVGNLICLALGFFTPKPKPIDEPKRIAIVKFWALGESVLVLPLIVQLKKHYPNATIDVIAHSRNASVFTDHPSIDRVYKIDKDKIRWRRQYDLAFDCEPYFNLSAIIAFMIGRQTVGFDHGLRSRLYVHKVHYNDNQHATLTYLDLARPFFDPSIPTTLEPLHFSPEARRAAEQFLKNHHIAKKDLVIGICATAAESGPSRYWPADRFAQLIDYLVKTYSAQVIIVGTAGDRVYNEALVHQTHHTDQVVNASGQTSIKELFALMPRFDVFISNDTGPMHIAAAQGVPTIGLFCPNTPVRFGPYGPKNTTIYKPVLPQPCINVHLGSIPDCETHGHMQNIHVNDVVKAVKKIIGR